MSTIGSSGAGIPPLAGSVAGAAGQQRLAESDQQSAAGAAKTFAAQRQAQLNRTIGDVGESEGAGDRDADGREAWRYSQQTAPTSADGQKIPHPKDPDSERGQQLDLDA